MRLTLKVVLMVIAVATLAPKAWAETPYDGAYFKRVTLVVADMERALTLYRDILGFHLDGISESSSDSYSYPVFKIPQEAKIRFATLSAGSEQIRTLALTEVTGMELPKPGQPLMSAAVIRSADIERDFRRIEALGLETTEPKFVEGREFDFRERAFVDFDGHLIVLYQIVEEPLSAARIVERAYEEAGGEAWRRPETLRLSGVATLYEQGHADRVTVADRYDMWRVFPQQSDDAHRANGKVRFDAFAGDDLVFQVSYDGEKTYDHNGVVPPERARRDWSAAFGFGILRFALDDGFRVERLADDQVEGHDCYFVRVIDPSESQTMFGIDQTDFSVRMVGFETPRGWHHRVYSDFEWHEAPRFRQPTRVRLYYDGVKTNDIHWQEFAVNAPLDDALFDLTQ
ncbi:MAG: VOC family protein [Acidobacteriota bacterium]